MLEFDVERETVGLGILTSVENDDHYMQLLQPGVVLHHPIGAFYALLYLLNIPAVGLLFNTQNSYSCGCCVGLYCF